jgi:hypothetical protein
VHQRRLDRHAERMREVDDGDSAVEGELEHRSIGFDPGSGFCFQTICMPPRRDGAWGHNCRLALFGLAARRFRQVRHSLNARELWLHAPRRYGLHRQCFAAGGHRNGENPADQLRRYPARRCA